MWLFSVIFRWSFDRCDTLPVHGASLYWTYHAVNGTDMAGSNVFVATQDGGGAVSMLIMTVLESTAPSLTNGTLKFDVPVPPTAEYAAGAYTIYTTVALPRNSTVQNTVWQAGPLSGGSILPHPTSGPNVLSFQRQDFLSG